MKRKYGKVTRFGHSSLSNACMWSGERSSCHFRVAAHLLERVLAGRKERGLRCVSLSEKSAQKCSGACGQHVRSGSAVPSAGCAQFKGSGECGQGVQEHTQAACGPLKGNGEGGHGYMM